MIVGLTHYLVLGTAIFFVGIIGLVANARNFISILISIEVMLLGVNINFIAITCFSDAVFGAIATISVLTISAIDAAIFLAIIVTRYRLLGQIDVMMANKFRN